MKYFIILLALIFTACSTSQFTYHKIEDESNNWRIEVVNGTFNNYICKINGIEVMEDSFGVFSKSFEKDGMYLDKRIKMSGYMKTFSTYDSEGKSTSDNTYHIRVFINETEVAKFEF